MEPLDTVDIAIDDLKEFELNEVNVTSMAITPICDQVLGATNDDEEIDRILNMFQDFLVKIINET